MKVCPDLSYALYVEGDVAATSFVNISTREAKRDITYYSDEDKRSVLEKLKTTGVATYYYKNEACGSTQRASDSRVRESDARGACTPRLGLIAEEAPAEVLSANKKGVDVYKLATFILAGVQEQQKRIDAMDIRITKLEALMFKGHPRFPRVPLWSH